MRIAVVGAGPCGLACARELERLGHPDWAIFERLGSAGGHASSTVDSRGFTWDLGGHVIFSHFEEFDALIDEVMGDDLYEHERLSYVRYADRWIPYPFQNNLGSLPPDIALECLIGLIEAPAGRAGATFAEWMEATLGSGIVRHFMRPYNEKLWATAAEQMSAAWIVDRVSVVDYKRALTNFVLQREDTDWGPNQTFRFPKSGGTGEIWRRLAARLGKEIAYGREVVAIDPKEKSIRFQDGGEHWYDALVSTMPLSLLVEKLTDCPDAVRDAAGLLEHTSIFVVGVGYEAPLDDNKSWAYFPDETIPFYRATNFAAYAPANVPEEDTSRYCSYMTETAFSTDRPVVRGGLEDRVLASLAEAAVAPEGAPVASVEVLAVDHAYPVPTIDRDAALDRIQPWLSEHGIYSRGRFGTWRYEVGNMDHAVKMGIEVARFLVCGEPEELWAREG